MYETFLVLILQVTSLRVNPSATCVSSTPITTCSAWHSPPRPPDFRVRTPAPSTVGGLWAPRLASPWAGAAAAAAPAWVAPLRTASGWDRRRRRRPNSRQQLISGTSSPGKGPVQRQWYDKGREEEDQRRHREHEGSKITGITGELVTDDLTVFDNVKRGFLKCNPKIIIFLHSCTSWALHLCGHTIRTRGVWKKNELETFDSWWKALMRNSSMQKVVR